MQQHKQRKNMTEHSCAVSLILHCFRLITRATPTHLPMAIGTLSHHSLLRRPPSLSTLCTALPSLPTRACRHVLALRAMCLTCASFSQQRCVTVTSRKTPKINTSQLFRQSCHGLVTSLTAKQQHQQQHNICLILGDQLQTSPSHHTLLLWFSLDTPGHFRSSSSTVQWCLSSET